MKTGLSVVITGIALLLTVFAVSAQDMAVRHGVVTAMEAVQGKSAVVSTSTKRRLGGLIGRAIGQAVAGNSGFAYEAADMGERLVGDMASSSGDARTVASYMLMIRFTDGAEIATTRTGAQLRGVKVGSRVKVAGSGDSAMIIAE